MTTLRILLIATSILGIFFGSAQAIGKFGKILSHINSCNLTAIIYHWDNSIWGTFLETTDNNSNRIPTKCNLTESTERTCSKFFHDVLTSYGEISLADKKAVKNKFCEFPWNMFSHGRFGYIRCEKAPGYVKTNCQNICNPGNSGNIIRLKLIDIILFVKYFFHN